MPLDVLHDDDRIVHHKADAKHDGQKCEKVHREPRRLHQEHRAEDGQGNGHNRNHDGPQRTEEQEDDDDDDEQGLRQRLEHLADRIGDIHGRVVADARVETGGQLGFDLFELLTHRRDDIEGVGVGEHPHAHEDRLLPGETHRGIVVLGTQHHVGNVLEPNDRATAFPQYQLLELFHGAQVGVGGEVDRDRAPWSVRPRQGSCSQRGPRIMD